MKGKQAVNRTQNKTAFVTGISSGVGKHLALDLAKVGYTVIGISRTEPDYLDASLPVHWLSIDLSQPLDEALLLMHIENYVEAIDLVIFNAAVAVYGQVLDLKPNDILRMNQTNFLSVLFLFRTLSPLLKDHGQLIFVTSSSVLFPAPGVGIYSATKYTQEHLAMTLNVELASRNISCRIVRPGGIQSMFGVKAGYPGADPEAGMAAEYVAKKVIRSIKGNRLVTNLGLDCRVMLVLHKIHHRLCLFISQQRHNK